MNDILKMEEVRAFVDEVKNKGVKSFGDGGGDAYTIGLLSAMLFCAVTEIDNKGTIKRIKKLEV